MPAHTLVIDLASKPGGTDFRYAEKESQSVASTWITRYCCSQSGWANFSKCSFSVISSRCNCKGGGKEMSLKGKRIGFGFTGSHCTYEEVMPHLEKLIAEGAEVRPVVSYTVQSTNTRFGEGAEWIKKIEEITGFKAINSIVGAEPLGPKIPLDCMVIAPLTGNSMSKFANAMTDSPVLMAAKATLRNGKPVVLAVSTNDALGLNGVNLITPTR